MADNLNFNYGITINLANCGAMAGTGFSFTTTAATSAAINGKFAASLPVQTNAVMPTMDAGTGLPFNPVPPSQTCALVFGVNSAGALQVVQSRVIPMNAGPTGTVPGGLLNEPQFPGLPNDFCPLAYTVVRTASAAVQWTPGVSAWAAAGVAFSPFQSVAQLPNRPQAS